jgi:hypothetical protein
MATPYRSTCTIDGQKFNCLSISVAFSTAKDRSGMPRRHEHSLFHYEQPIQYVERRDDAKGEAN